MQLPTVFHRKFCHLAFILSLIDCRIIWENNLRRLLFSSFQQFILYILFHKKELCWPPLSWIIFKNHSWKLTSKYSKQNFWIWYFKIWFLKNSVNTNRSTALCPSLHISPWVSEPVAAEADDSTSIAGTVINSYTKFQDSMARGGASLPQKLG